jgi:hypothetical protein
MFGKTCPRFRAPVVDFAGLAEFLRKEHPAKTAEFVEARCGIPSKTVRKWLEGENAPNGAAVLTLALFYGPQALSACLKGAPAWLDAANRDEMVRKKMSEIEDLQRQLSQLRG